ncbi:hypothetical protein CLAFUW4_12312 [Fulvia fulva]|uniref:Uncharacterized protein n=1 Tax=Passalora fulva TaxID=5499 RepID=A0A9Q8PEN0_PASFU|nr:uncharacterized protein CLAFUR5_11342 [Fulvia fulva]KAK4617666.1 hypothetical protein CLAFUR4_12317 [Fulvia fulva]KAK4618427.1 hypothetical protein CLAFUR0_12328 [Fulvia fulva]UJO21007.1 hypothetical protein CLAFUR5_11342 [Fulvia fulva]WPV17823.1 hypothetical protein CLAFUW4_12312 [Fulvia fulva]WPV33263.1 hypothetical protein CLAFUW7_12319 [Fulvia fulva]
MADFGSLLRTSKGLLENSTQEGDELRIDVYADPNIPHSREACELLIYHIVKGSLPSTPNNDQQDYYSLLMTAWQVGESNHSPEFQDAVML